MRRAQALDAFEAYVSGYDASDPKVALKVDHTLRVAGLCDRIARSPELALPPRDADLAWLCGLLHDLGRFEQLRCYGTFDDARSVSHAAVSAGVLFDGGRIRDYLEDADEDSMLETVVATHSAWRLPDGLCPRTRMFADILRDADKVDILEVNCVNTTEDIYGVPEAAMRESPLSPACVRAFYEHRTIRRDLKRYPADLLVGHVCFVWELVYPESLRIALEQGYLARMLDYPFADPMTRERFAAMGGHLRDWLVAR